MCIYMYLRVVLLSPPLFIPQYIRIPQFYFEAHPPKLRKQKISTNSAIRQMS